jgi:hypothetical protein
MPELGPSGSARGAVSNHRPYRDPAHRRSSSHLLAEGPCLSSRQPPEHSRIDGVSARPLTPEPEIDGPQHGGDSAGFPPGLNQSLLQCGALSPNL